VKLARLLRLLGAYAVVLAIACLGVRSWASLSPTSGERRAIVRSRWLNGSLLERAAHSEKNPPPEEPARDGIIVDEIAVAESPLSLSKIMFPLSLVPGLDGIRADIDGKTIWITTDDLLVAQAYDRASSFLDPSLGMGTRWDTTIGLVAARASVTPQDVEQRAVVRRIRWERRTVGVPAPKRITKDDLDRKNVLAAISEAAQFIARGVDAAGRYRYIIEATTDATVAGYNWPRHAGTTYFLAQAAALLDDAFVRFACLRAAAALRDQVTKDCGDQKCIAEENEASVGSSALGLIAYAEIVRTKAGESYKEQIGELARFLRSQQRADGELMHFYDRGAKKPIDVQVMYFTGEAALALSRAHRVTGNPEDLEAAKRALANLSGKGWSFFGSRYYFAEEHWTCQAVADLWDRAPDEKALEFCLRWHEYQRRLQHEDGDSPFDGDGSFGFSPLVTPRVTPASSRGEAAVAALDVVKKKGDAAAAALLEDELRRALAFVMRSQLLPGPHHLFARPDVTRGGFPGSAVDHQLRIDYAQHAGSMMIRFLEVTGPSLATP